MMAGRQLLLAAALLLLASRGAGAWLFSNIFRLHSNGVEVAGDSPADSVASREDYTAVHLHHLLGRGDAHSHLPDSAARKAEQEPPVVARVHTHTPLTRLTLKKRSGGGNAVGELRERLVADRPRKYRLPNASTCNFCGKCGLTDTAEDYALSHGQLGGTSMLLAMEQTAQNPHDEAFQFYSRPHDDRQALRNCTKCSGCRNMVNHLADMKVKFKGTAVDPQEGRSRSIVYRVSSERAAHGVAIGKVQCIPFGRMIRDREVFEPCDAAYEAFLREKQYPTVTAGGRIAHECGLGGVAPASWVENITGLMPGTGYVIQREMLMQDIVKGVSLSSVHRHLSDHDGEKLLASVNSTSVILAAIYDLLLTSEDRHNDNVLIDSYGHMSLIDNDKILNLEHGIPKSIFFPTSIYMWYNLVGRGFVNSYGKDDHLSKPSYNLMLDYRCHVKSVNGREDESFTLGTNYPRQVKQCLARMDSMSQSELLAEYSLPDAEAALMLKQRVSDMLHLGFEAALDHATPYCHRFPWTKPCCSWKGGNTRGTSACADTSWKPETWSLLNCVKTGRSSFEEVHHKSNWKYVKPSQHTPSIEETALTM